ncbi:MAG: TIGR03790 family protein [Actinobacteria bacterium]|nr:TIGR03790 family protein [Actinomycetota bacterium]
MVVGVRRSSSYRLLRSALVMLLTILAAASALWAGGGPRNVAVVININSAESREIGLYYQKARGIPDSNICCISCPTQEVVTGVVCETRIREPIRQFLQRPNVAGNIDYIVLTKGVPLSADYGRAASRGPYSVASILTAVDYPEIKDLFAFPYGPVALAKWTTNAPEIAWSHSLTFIDRDTSLPYHFYLVTRLDAYTVDQVKSMIYHAVHPAVDGTFVLDKVPNTGIYSSGDYQYANLRLGTPYASAYDHLVKKGFDIRFDPGTDFLSNLRGVMGYFSWAEHDSAQYTFAKYVSNIFVPGSVADTYSSYSGKTFTDPHTTDREPLIADLFANGLCGAGAYVSEPTINAATQPNFLFDRYTKGYNMAESFYAACCEGFWKTVIIGDPLMAPYATPPSVSISVRASTLSGVEDITANASDEAGVAKVVFCLDDTKLGEVLQPPFTMTVDTSDYAIGTHTIEAIAFENSAVGTQGSAKLPITIDNLISTVSSISDAVMYPGGQSVRIKSKVVTAGRGEIGDGFYIEEADRSSGIKVLSTEPVMRGDIVTVRGPIGGASGERAIVNPIIESRTPGGKVPRPLGMRLDNLGGAALGQFTLPVGRGFGARNTSLLVRVVGKVISSASGEFRISDSSTPVPVRVVCPAGAQPPVDVWVAVTGISIVEQSNSELRPSVRARDAADIQLL